jgi:EAL domain-containing protein (putative c-di-GMP-specific phosphodiesterase class I)
MTVGSHRAGGEARAEVEWLAVRKEGNYLSLEHRPDADETPVRVPLFPLPFRIGRSPEAELVLGSPRISKLHAEIDANGRGYVVRDLGSRNGTFLNGERIDGERALRVGDVIHVAHRELKLVAAEPNERGIDDSTLAGQPMGSDADYYRGTRDLYRILSGRTVRAVFQAIVGLGDASVIGYEALGRHTLAAADYDATSLFRLAHERGKATELSRIMRSAALSDVPALPRVGERVFMNVHPAEMRDNGLLDELERAAQGLKAAQRTLVAEIHEAAIVDPATMRQLKSELRSRGIEIAYDDFGAGRARLMELAEVPPDFLKLDMSLVRGIDESPKRQELVAAIVRVMREAGIRVIAEGIETAAEHRACRELGCDLGQGFLIRHPLSVMDLRDTWP